MIATVTGSKFLTALGTAWGDRTSGPGPLAPIRSYVVLMCGRSMSVVKGVLARFAPNLRNTVSSQDTVTIGVVRDEEYTPRLHPDVGEDVEAHTFWEDGGRYVHQRWLTLVAWVNVFPSW